MAVDRKKSRDKPEFDIEDRGYRARAWYVEDSSEGKGDALIEIFKGDVLLREFLFPGYKIWNIAAHFGDIVDGELEQSYHGYRMASWTGIGPGYTHPAPPEARGIQAPHPSVEATACAEPERRRAGEDQGEAEVSNAPVTPETREIVEALRELAAQWRSGFNSKMPLLVEEAATKLSAVTASLASANEQLAAERAARETAEHWQGDFTEACRQRDQAEARLKVVEELTDLWMKQQAEYPELATAAATIRVCVRELRAALRGGTPDGE